MTNDVAKWLEGSPASGIEFEVRLISDWCQFGGTSKRSSLLTVRLCPVLLIRYAGDRETRAYRMASRGRQINRVRYGSVAGGRDTHRLEVWKPTSGTSLSPMRLLGMVYQQLIGGNVTHEGEVCELCGKASYGNVTHQHCAEIEQANAEEQTRGDGGNAK